MFAWGMVVGLAAGVLAAVIVVKLLEARMKESFKALASDALHANSQMLSESSSGHLQNLVAPLKENLASLDGHVRELERARAGAYQSLEQQLGQLRGAHERLQQTTVTLSEALRSPTVRGRWGEVQLRRVVEMAGMERHVAFDEQVGGDQGRPDMVVYLPQSAALPIDSKVPLDAYLKAAEAQDAQQRAIHMADHAQAVRRRIQELGRKQYWEQFDKAPDFVVMFVPNEACLAAAFDQDRDLLTYAMGLKVLLASPVTLLALLKTVAYGWAQHESAENARHIVGVARELASRVETFMDHVATIGKSLGKSVDAYNAAVSSYERRVLPSARRLQDLHAIDTAPSALTPVTPPTDSRGGVRS